MQMKQVPYCVGSLLILSCSLSLLPTSGRLAGQLIVTVLVYVLRANEESILQCCPSKGLLVFAAVGIFQGCDYLLIQHFMPEDAILFSAPSIFIGIQTMLYLGDRAGMKYHGFVACTLC
jgi:hypothetical protein